ncbi:hypothetical protein K9N68_04465 [Kovacikia minuta CCNUW1]|uniref:hypothetical protein n=1 Tax=Kovacikia minuta TaxID=2931930 RepID=UPI001CCD3268|nr:hypothetical protein [Kovacikia minuta]UBF27225.1 hypothetical protein K9N68_04465 [Kovacikia minuta CCNUW1]
MLPGRPTLLPPHSASTGFGADPVMLPHAKRSKFSSEITLRGIALKQESNLPQVTNGGE